MVIAKYNKKTWLFSGSLSQAMDKVEADLMSDNTKYERTHNLIIDEGGEPIIFIPITVEEFKRRFNV